MGVERMLLLLEAVGVLPPAQAPDVYAIVPAIETLGAAIAACEALRSAGVSVLMHGAGAESWGGMKSQFKRADASGARHALIFGADELSRGEVSVKSLRDPAVPQRSLKLADAAHWAADLRTA
jgi:histidyl-tRNA synthetase